MVSKRYRVTGFDCPACAEKCERHLANKEGVLKARIDFAGEVLYLSSEEDLSKEAIKAIFAEVEHAPVELGDYGEKKTSKISKKDIVLIVRVLIAITAFFVCGFAFKDLYWVRFGIYLFTLAAISYDIFLQVASNVAHKRNPLDEYLLILVASVGAFVLACVGYHDSGSAIVLQIGSFAMEAHYEAVLVCLLWQIGELLQTLAVKKSQNAIVSAVSKRVDKAWLVTSSGVVSVDAGMVQKGDEVMVSAGGVVPVDGEVVSGDGYYDTSSLTGEPLPVSVSSGSKVFSGTVVTSGEIRVKAIADYASSAEAKILDLVSSSNETQGAMEKTITKFARVYTPVIFGVAILVCLLAGFLWTDWKSAVFTGLEILVISCPCALVISVPLAYFASVGLASKNLIVVKGASYLDALQEVSTVVMDKTGTLTTGEFALDECVVCPGYDEEAFKRTLGSLESHADHPIASSVLRCLALSSYDEVKDYRLIPGKGVEGEIHGKHYVAGNASMMEERGVTIPDGLSDGVTVFVADSDSLMGYVRLVDEPRPGSRALVSSLHEKGVKSVILSGDKKENVSALATELGIDAWEAELLPEEKLSLLRKEKETAKGKLAFLGDGMNDAPSLAEADVGIAMGGGGNALACEEAKILLLDDDPSGVTKAMRIASSCRRVIITNIVFALAVKATVMVLAILLGQKLPMEVAVLADTGVSVLATLHSLLLLTKKL